MRQAKPIMPKNREVNEEYKPTPQKMKNITMIYDVNYTDLS